MIITISELADKADGDIEQSDFIKVINAIDTICECCNIPDNDWDVVREEIADLVRGLQAEQYTEDNT